jgi:hypothetical protein
MNVGRRLGIGRMSRELNDVTHALAELLVVVGQSNTEAGVEFAITQVVDGLVMALGGIEHRLDLLERDRVARLH